MSNRMPVLLGTAAIGGIGYYLYHYGGDVNAAKRAAKSMFPLSYNSLPSRFARTQPAASGIGMVPDSDNALKPSPITKLPLVPTFLTDKEQQNRIDELWYKHRPMFAF